MLTKLNRWVAGLFLLGTLAVGAAADTPATVAVLNFSAPTAESNRWDWAAGGLADLLQINLEQQGLRLLDRDLIRAVLKEQRWAANGQIASGSLAAGKLLNAQYLVAGKIDSLPDGKFRVEASVFSVEAVQIEAVVSGEGNFPKDLTAVLQDMARQIARKFPENFRAATNREPVVRPPNPESLIMFYRGLNACAAGRPEWGAAYFINATDLDSDFTVPLLWEVKAYDLAGLPQLAAIRREEMSALLSVGDPLLHSTTNATRHANTTKPVLAVLNSVINVQDNVAKTMVLEEYLNKALLADGRVRVFAYGGIGSAVAEQDLRLSSLFTSQNAPRYGRWLMADGLLFCSVQSAESGQVSVELSLVNPLDATVTARVRRIFGITAIDREIPGVIKQLVSDWLNQQTTKSVSTSTVSGSTLSSSEFGSDLRPIYRDLSAALVLAQREPAKSDSHRGLANALGATGRPKLAAHEIEQCLERLDIHAPHADTTYLGTHRWLFWEPSPVGGAVGLVNRKLIDQMIDQLLTNYPQTLAVGCMRYNLSVTAWREQRWQDAITQAQQSRRILKTLIQNYDRAATTGVNRGDLDCEMAAATYYLEGSSLGKLGQSDAAKVIYHQGLDFMQASKVRDFCLPLGPFTGDFFGPQRVYGYGGDPPGIKTRLELALSRLGETITRPAPKPQPTVVAAISKTPGADWIQKGQSEYQLGKYRAAVEDFQKALTDGATMATCPDLPVALLEIALAQNPEHPQDEFEKLRRELGFPLVQASWVEWFAAGRKYQTSRQFDWQKAAASYRGALDFLEHPEKTGVYHLEKEPCCDRWNLRWGPTLGEVDLLWTKHYDQRWYSAAFYLAECLVQLNQKEEAASWFRQIALKVGGDSTVPLLERDTWNSSGWSSANLGVRAAQLAQDLHAKSSRAEFGLMAGPYQLPARSRKANPVLMPPLPPVEAALMQPLTNALAEAGKTRLTRERKERLQPVIAANGHQLVPNALSLLLAEPGSWDKGLLVSILEQTANTNDSPWIVAAAAREWGLIPLAERLAPDATASVLYEAWQEHEGDHFVSPDLIRGIVMGRVRPLFSLVLDQIAEMKVNHWSDIILVDGIADQENSKTFEIAFRDALSQCLKQKLLQHQHYELGRIARVALKHGVPEGIDGLLVSEASSPEKLRLALGDYLNLPKTDSELVSFLNQNHGRWQWNAALNKFELPKTQN